jgi:serine/threonine-protein kinase
MKTCPTCQASYPTNYAVCPADGSPLEEVGTWEEGSVIRGKYRLLAKVGQGGMGSVYKALHLAFDELRALKVIAPELLSDELFVKRFKHEAVITRRLQHPHAVRVDDIDEAEDGRPFIVMEFIEGKSLKKLIREEGPLPVGRVCTIIKQTADALDAAHRLAMIHRDIKPDNIALVDGPEGEMVKVLDFGIAKVKEARMGEAANLTLTGAGVVIGTPQYMSPEQAMGKRGDELDGRSDLYSLGVVMYQMLTADLPFKADTTMEMLLAHVQKPPAPIGESHPELQVPEPIAALTLRLLEKNRDLRPASGRVLIQEIERIERDMLSPPRTRTVTTDDLIRVGESRTAARDGAVPPRPPQPAPTRPVEPPKPVPPPVARPQPQVVAAPLPRPRAAESNWGKWIAIIILVVALGGGALYLATRSTTPQPPPALAPIATLTANPTTVERGQPITLSWASENATDLDLEPGVGKVQAQGSTSVSPQDTTTYTLTATGPGGTQKATAPVTVTAPSPPPPNPEPTPPPQQPQPAPPPRETHNRRPQPPAPTPGPSPVNERQVRAKITMGDFHFKRGEYDDAIREYEEGLKLDPTNRELLDKLAHTKQVRDVENRVLK